MPTEREIELESKVAELEMALGATLSCIQWNGHSLTDKGEELVITQRKLWGAKATETLDRINKDIIDNKCLTNHIVEILLEYYESLKGPKSENLN